MTDLYMTLKHISNYKSPLWRKQCKSFGFHFLEMTTLLYHLTLRGRNFTLALGKVLKLMSNQSCLVALSDGINNFRMTKLTVTPFVKRVTLYRVGQKYRLTLSRYALYIFCKHFITFIMYLLQTYLFNTVYVHLFNTVFFSTV